MNKHRFWTTSAIAAAACVAIGTAVAADDLTPAGADRSASKDGAVPAYAGDCLPA